MGKGIRNIAYVNKKPYFVDTASNFHKNLIQWLNEDGQYHRTDGPARVMTDHNDQWFIHGENITVEVEKWMKDNHVSWPFVNITDELLVEFNLKFL